MGDLAFEIIEWFMENIFGWLVILAVLALVGWLGWYGVHSWQHRNDPPPVSVSLPLNEWACTQMHRIPTTIYIKSGDVMVPITTYHKECYQWSKQ